MARFTYKAIDAQGKSIMGQIEALNIVDLEMRLQRMGLDLITGGLARRDMNPFGGSPVTRTDSVSQAASANRRAAASARRIIGLAPARSAHILG